jgi:hypothetical protein
VPAQSFYRIRPALRGGTRFEAAFYRFVFPTLSSGIGAMKIYPFTLENTK